MPLHYHVASPACVHGVSPQPIGTGPKAASHWQALYSAECANNPLNNLEICKQAAEFVMPI